MKILMICSLILLIGGCKTIENVGLSGSQMDDQGQEGIMGRVMGNNGLNSLKTLFIVGSVLSLFVGLNGLRAGWLALGSCLFGLWLSSALTNVWVYWAAGISLLGVGILAGVSIWRKNKALRQIILGTQNLKKAYSNFAGGGTGCLKIEQDKDTQRLVQEVKSELKLKDKM